MSLDTKTIEALDDCQKRGDAGRAAYYRTLATAGDPYGRMALGVVEQSNMAGKVAYSYAKEVAKRYCRPLSGDRWTKISVDLMRSDFAARRGPESLQCFGGRHCHASAGWCGGRSLEQLRAALGTDGW